MWSHEEGSAAAWDTSIPYQGHPRRHSYWFMSVLHQLLVLCVALTLMGMLQLSSGDNFPFMTSHALGRAHPAAGLVGVKHYYLALGDSLAYGLQPDLNTFQSYPAQWFEDLRQYGSQAYVNYSCVGETTETFIKGRCPLAWAEHTYHQQSQLDAAIAFLKVHPGQVSPVSLDIGANDMLVDIQPKTCRVSEDWSIDLSVMDWRLNQIILPQLLAALTDAHGARTGDLVMMNYYNPYQNLCPNDARYIQQLNAHLARDAAHFHIPLVDVFAAFGGTQTPNQKICQYTWMCGIFRDIDLVGDGVHATTAGYRAIAQAFEARTGY